MNEATYTQADLYAAWVAGCRHAEYRYKLLPVNKVLDAEAASKALRNALARGDDKTFHRWLADHEYKQERRRMHGFLAASESMKVLHPDPLKDETSDD